ncbi:MAG TPA: AsnC family protein [Bordetella sp.]|nr:AsnC family protein [Bordetella sp.]
MTQSTTLARCQALQLRRLLEAGLPVAQRPYQLLAAQIGATEAAVLDQVRHWNSTGLFRRVGLVLNHRALGFRANAMLVIDIPDAAVDDAGRLLGLAPGINLCYQRPRRLPDWPYNLFCMVHGRQRDEVRQRIDALLRQLGLEALPHQLLFSTRAFKQRGGRYTPGDRHG